MLQMNWYLQAQKTEYKLSSIEQSQQLIAETDDFYNSRYFCVLKRSLHRVRRMYHHKFNYCKLDNVVQV